MYGYILYIMQEIKLSVSKTKTFLDCKKKYNFTYIQKLPRKDRDFHIFGKFVHKVLEEFHKSYIDGSQIPFHIEMKKCYNLGIEEFKDSLTEDQKKECFDICKRYLEMLSKQKKEGTLPTFLAAEKTFNINIEIPDKNGLVILNGFIDRIQIDKDNVLHVCDYKTVKNKKYLKNDFFQLLTYAYALLIDDPTLQVVRGSYILLRHDFEYITKDFSREEILQIKDKFIKYADDICEEKLWRPNVTPLCKYCDFLENCDEGKSNYGSESNNYGEVKWI